MLFLRVGSATRTHSSMAHPDMIARYEGGWVRPGKHLQKRTESEAARSPVFKNEVSKKMILMLRDRPNYPLDDGAIAL